MNTTPTDHKIEFMAWDSVLKVILKSKSLNGNTFSKNNQFMQLTALRSVNDEPIYNHMIVKVNSGSMFIVDMFNYSLMDWLSELDLRIVGNRFQSPELLELCK